MRITDLNEHVQRFWQLWVEDRAAGRDTPKYRLYKQIHPGCQDSTAVTNSSVYWAQIKKCVEFEAYFDVIDFSPEMLDKRLRDALNATEVEVVILPDGGFDYREKPNMRGTKALLELAMRRLGMLKDQIVFEASDQTETMTLADLMRLAERKRKEAEQNDSAGD